MHLTGNLIPKYGKTSRFSLEPGKMQPIMEIFTEIPELDDGNMFKIPYKYLMVKTDDFRLRVSLKPNP